MLRATHTGSEPRRAVELRGETQKRADCCAAHQKSPVSSVVSVHASVLLIVTQTASFRYCSSRRFSCPSDAPQKVNDLAPPGGRPNRPLRNGLGRRRVLVMDLLLCTQWMQRPSHRVCVPRGLVLTAFPVPASIYNDPSMYIGRLRLHAESICIHVC